MKYFHTIAYVQTASFKKKNKFSKINNIFDFKK